MVVAWWSLAALAADVEGTASGFVELRNVWSLGVDGKPWLLVERFRPTFEAELSKRVHLEATVEVGLQQGRLLQDEFDRTLLESRLNQPVSVGDSGTPLTRAGCEVVGEDAANGLFHIDGIDDYASVDRLFADVYLGDADLRFGRQAVQWGNALLVHPADPFPEVLFLEPWRPRRGVNAARLNLQLGEASGVTVLGGIDDALREARVAGRITANVLETDFALIGAYRADRPSRAALEVPTVPTRNFPGLGADVQVPAAPLPGSGILGVDIKGTLELGFWLEGSWHFQPEPADATGQDDFAEVAVGLDYSFDILDQFVFGAQYYYNGAGSVDPDGLALAGRFSGALAPPVCVGDAADLFSATSAEVDPFAT
nr:hypothetical protein [Deltaproteobacteria bacterium]